MEIVKSIEDIKKLKNNKIIIEDLNNFEMAGTTVTFNGSGNILYINSQKGIKIKNTNIKFEANNSVVYLNDNSHYYILNLTLYNNNTFYMGKNNYMNNTLTCITSEEKNIIIGDSCLFSFGIWIRTADPHLIYDSKTHKRINKAKSSFIGDHVWLGQNVTLLKGAMIGSGSIIGASSLVSKKLESNSVYGGNPIKLLKKNIFWEETCTHRYTKKDAKKLEKFESDKFMYDTNNDKFFKKIDKNLNSLASADEKLKYLKETLSTKNKNRFAIIFPTGIKRVKNKLRKVKKKVVKSKKKEK